MKKFQYIVIFILLTAVLCGCSQEGTEYVISEFDSESKIEIEISDAPDTKVNVSVKYKIFEYNDYEYYIGVVKGNAYGHGEYIVNTLIESGINSLFKTT